jgi:hypothetical protein
LTKETRIDPAITGSVRTAARLAGGFTGRGGNVPLTTTVVPGAAERILISV